MQTGTTFMIWYIYRWWIQSKQIFHAILNKKKKNKKGEIGVNNEEKLCCKYISIIIIIIIIIEFLIQFHVSKIFFSSHHFNIFLEINFFLLISDLSIEAKNCKSKKGSQRETIWGKCIWLSLIKRKCRRIRA